MILTIRPEPGAGATVAAGAQRGLRITAVPLFAIRPHPWQAPDPGPYAGLLLGSANALRQGGAGLDRLRALPAYAVGAATATAARAAGFAVARAGQGGLQAVLDQMGDQAPARLLRLAGAEHVPLVPPAGIAIDTCVVYENAPLPMPADLAARLATGRPCVLLHSALAASHFRQACHAHGVAPGGIALATLGPRIAAAAGPGWAHVAVAADPHEAALLALVPELCQ